MPNLTPAERARQWRRAQGVKPRKVKPCGTWAAAQRHQYRNEPVCEACRKAVSEHNHNQYMKRKGK